MAQLAPLEGLVVNRTVVGLATAAFVIVLFAGNASSPLIDQDEGAYAGFAQTMIRGGDWTEPSFIWSEKHRKPPLHFWLMAGSMLAFGETEFAVRFHSACSLLLTCWIVFLLGRRVFGEQIARVAALLLMTSAFASAGKIALCDPLLLLFETTAVLSMLIYLEEGRARWSALACVCIALGMLTKGPPVLILTGGLYVVLAILHPLRRNLLGLRPWILLPVACLPFLAWGYAAWSSSEGELVRWMFDWYVVRRIGGSVFGQTGPPGFYLATFAVGLFPWFGFLPAALVDTLARVRRREPQAIAIVAWLAAGWIFYELVPSKLPRYALASYPALAFILADQVLRLTPERLRGRRSLWWGIHLQAGLGMLGALAVAALGWLAVPGTIAWSCVFAGALLGVSTLYWIGALRRGRLALGLVAAAAGTLGFSVSVSLLVAPALSHQFGVTRVVADELESMAPADATVVFSNRFRMPSLAFYLGRSEVRYRQRDAGETLEAVYASQAPQLLVFRRSRDFERFLEDRPDAETLRAKARRIDGWSFNKLERVSFWLLPNWEARSAWEHLRGPPPSALRSCSGRSDRGWLPTCPRSFLRSA